MRLRESVRCMGEKDTSHSSDSCLSKKIFKKTLTRTFATVIHNLCLQVWVDEQTDRSPPSGSFSKLKKGGQALSFSFFLNCRQAGPNSEHSVVHFDPTVTDFKVVLKEGLRFIVHFYANVLSV